LISQSGFTEFTGFYTIALPISVTLQEGNDFYVYLSLSRGGQPFDRTSEVPVLLVEESYLTIVNSISNPDESFYWDGAQWQDMYFYADPPWPAGTANLCIKALTSEDNFIPVELTSFSAVQEGENIKLDWATATETNNQQFEILRRTINEERIDEWILVGYREGKGTTTEPQHYSYIDDISGINATAFEYRLKQVDFDGSYSFSEVIRVDNIAPAEFSLEQNYPNPFNPSTEIKFSIPQTTNITLRVFDIMGREVVTLIDEQMEAGKHSIVFNAANLSSGVYYYTIITENFIQTNKMILLK